MDKILKFRLLCDIWQQQRSCDVRATLECGRTRNFALTTHSEPDQLFLFKNLVQSMVFVENRSTLQYNFQKLWRFFTLNHNFVVLISTFLVFFCIFYLQATYIYTFIGYKFMVFKQSLLFFPMWYQHDMVRDWP